MSEKQFVGTPAFTEYEAFNKPVVNKIEAGKFVKLNTVNNYVALATAGDEVIGVAGEETFKDGQVLMQTVYFQGLVYCVDDPNNFGLKLIERNVALKKYDNSAVTGFVVNL